MKKTNYPLIIALSVAGLLVFLGLLFGSVFFITRIALNNSDKMNEEVANLQENLQDKLPEENTKQESSEYYEFGDAIVDDLDYQITWEEYKYQDDADMNIKFTYPVVIGDSDIIDNINQQIYGEIEESVSYMEDIYSYGIYSSFKYFGESYVTYMDEKVLSIVFNESETIDSYQNVYLMAYNFDVNTGLLIDKASIMPENSDFIVDFRERCEKQNGAIEALDAYSDEEINSLINDDSRGVVFFTPLGKEVGFNYEGGWVTVTYLEDNSSLRSI